MFVMPCALTQKEMTEINCFSFGITQLAVLKLQKVGKKMPAIATAVAAVQRVNVFVLS